MKINKYLMLAAIALGSVSCNDSFLDRTPTNDLINKAFWNTATDLEVYNNGIYNLAGSNGTYKFMVGFTDGAWSSKVGSIMAFEAMSDNFATMDGGQGWAATVAAGIENIPGGNPQYCGWDWSLLRRINEFVENYDRVNAIQATKNKYLGEALFFRAWFYCYMVQSYGDVPLILKTLNTESEELYGTRTPRKEVMAQVLDDISKACDYLPVDWGKAKPNRVDKGTALALKSRICLYEGTYQKYHGLGDGKTLLEECVKASQAIIDLNKYSIYKSGHPETDYRTLFTSDDLSTNKEVIFYRKYAPNLLTHRQCGYVTGLRNGGTKDFVDDFLCLDSDGKARPVATSTDYNNDTPENEFKNRDKRLAQTFLTPGKEAAAAMFQDAKLAAFKFPRLGDMKSWPSLTGYHATKYYTRDQDKKGYNKETQDYPLFRYAEVLLNLAEAKAELGTITAEDLTKTVDLLRARAGMPAMEFNPAMDPKYASDGISSLLVEIRRERRIELSFEMFRYQDLMRWAKGEKLAERVLGMRFEDSDFQDPRYDGLVFKEGQEGGKNFVRVFKAADGKQYVDAYAGTNFAVERRKFDPKKDYLRPIPKSAITKNTNISQNPGWVE